MQAPVPWLTKFVDKGGLDGLAKLLADLCRFNERSDADWSLIDTAMRCVKALQRTPEGIEALVRLVSASRRAAHSRSLARGCVLAHTRARSTWDLLTSVDVLALLRGSPAHARISRLC